MSLPVMPLAAAVIFDIHSMISPAADIFDVTLLPPLLITDAFD